MIVPMKKIHMVVQKKDVISALDVLRDMGTVHVEHLVRPEGEKVFELRNKLDKYQQALNIVKESKIATRQQESGDLDARADLILSRLARGKELKEAISSRESQLMFWEPWGDFSPRDIRDLRAQGVYIRLCQFPANKKFQVPEGVILEGMNELKNVKRCLAISRQEIDLPFTVIDLPAEGPIELKQKQKDDQSELAALEKKLSENARYVDNLNEAIKDIENELQFEEAVEGMGDEGVLSLLKGFAPAEQCPELELAAKNHHWGLLLEDVAQEDQPPTLIKNPWWIKISKPALDMIEIMPGYKEVDVSMVFLFFFTLFFALLIGDAAYGMFFMGIVLFLHIKFGGKVKDKTPFYLGYLLTGFTILYGVLSGTFFGQQWLPSSISPVIPWLTDNDHIKWLCFSIALVHLNIARIWSFCLKFPGITAVAELGWVMIIWSMYFLANFFVLGSSLPEFIIPLISTGVALALSFMVPPKDFLKKVPQEIIPFFLGVIGAGTDIMSYIRLFAVGLATVAVADAANLMPESLVFPVGIILLILLHVLNMILALMAILVHAIRLNVLEFSGHLGLQWSGIKYSPFKRQLQ